MRPLILCLALFLVPAALVAAPADTPTDGDLAALLAPEMSSVTAPAPAAPADGDPVEELDLGVEYAACTDFCTGEPCPNGQLCAQCCTSEGVNCGPLKCVDVCIWPRDF